MRCCKKSSNQRAADLASYGGALVYNSTGSTDSATSAANNIAALNGLSSGVTPTYVLSPSGDGNHAIRVTATTNLPLAPGSGADAKYDIAGQRHRLRGNQQQRPCLYHRAQQQPRHVRRGRHRWG